MVALYVMQINKGKMALEQVPKRWYEDVKKALETHDCSKIATDE